MKAHRSSNPLMITGGVVGHRRWWGMVLAALLAIGVLSAQAGDKAGTAKKSRAGRPKVVAEEKSKSRAQLPAKAEKDRRQVVTGSHIPKKIKRYGRTANTVSPVYILDRKDFERLGAANVGEALRRLPFAH